MRWERQRRSENVEDRRGRRVALGGRAGGLGLGGLLLLMAVGYLVGGDPLALLREGASPSTQVDSGTPGGPPPADDKASQFIRAVLGSTEDVWGGLFQQMGQRYAAPRLVLFSDGVSSACGMTSSAVGPFYCPPDQQVYIDLSFYRDLAQRFGAPGDFAQAYVVAHEVGHHVQNLLGTAGRVDKLRRESGEVAGNQLSVRQELQADCFAGVWGHHVARATSGLQLEEGDVEEGLAAAAAIGDDRMQRQSQGEVTPETWTHGSSEQRASWLRRGMSSGRVADCDTFQAGS
ncbi:MAG: KPN_02809 family neutral zinc metallopeptidase [Vicinamibacteraceae bacterium]